VSPLVRRSKPLRLMMTADAVGGVWHYAMDLASALVEHGVETVVAVVGPAPDEAQKRHAASIPALELVETGLPLDWVAGHPEAIRGAARALATLVATTRADIVQLHAAAFAVADFPVPVVAVHHSCLATWWRAVRGDAPMPADFSWRISATADGLHAADTLVAPSAAFAAATAQAYALASPPAVVRNGRSPASRRHSARPAPAAFTAGRLWDEGKNLATLDRAAAALPVPFYAAGPPRGPNGARVSLSHLRQLGSLGGADVRSWMAQRPVFASAALYEPFGLAVLEAAQAGCALVLSDIPTFRELWADAALLVPARDDQAFSDAIRGLLEDEDWRIALGRAARRRARCYGAAAAARGMLAVYGRLLDRPALEAAE
jgi:glycosyltransferase involved in cell wall biosynthesis